MSKHLPPLTVCVRLIGSYETIGPICGVDGKSPYLWAREARHRDAGDIPSSRHMRKLLAHSKRLGLGLTLEHLVNGASEAQIAAILEARTSGSEVAA